MLQSIALSAFFPFDLSFSLLQFAVAAMLKIAKSSFSAFYFGAIRFKVRRLLFALIFFSGAVLAAPQKGKHMSQSEIATLAGGCFWGVQDIIRKIPGVLKTRVGYTGGKTTHARYEDVKSGKTGHAEAIEIEFDPKKLNYESLLKEFFKLHDPTTLNRQGNDIGTQYRSAIFYHSATQKLQAERVKLLVDASGAWKKPLTTEITQAAEFWPAEEYHQDYLVKNPGGYTCHWVRDLKF